MDDTVSNSLFDKIFQQINIVKQRNILLKEWDFLLNLLNNQIYLLFCWFFKKFSSICVLSKL